MKILTINGSPHADGCTARALDIVENSLHAHGIKTTRIHIGNQAIRGCIACCFCKEHGRCVFDDAVNTTAPLFNEASGIIIGSPVYYAGINGQLRAFLDRLFFSSATTVDKTMKVGAGILSSRRAGSTSALDEIYRYFGITAMPIATSTYWNEIHGSSPEDIDKDPEGIQTLRNLAGNIAFLVKSIALGADKFGIPGQDRGAHTNFINK